MDGAVQIHESRREGVTVLRLTGRVNDDGLMVRLAQQLLDAGVYDGDVVLDLDGLVVEDAAALSALVARLGASAGGIALAAATDPTMRRALRACGSGLAGLACFPSVDEAIEVADPATASASRP
jgi:anti-anti-sigma regulatory factor